VLKSLNPGEMRQFTEQFSTNYTPDLFSWFQPKFMYQANYSWVKNAKREDQDRGGRIAAQGRFTGNVNVKLTDVIEVFYTPGARAGAAGRRGGVRDRGSRTGTAQQPKTGKRLEVTNPQLKALFKTLHTAAGKVSPIAFNYSRSRRAGEPAVFGQPDYAYRLGLVSESGLQTDTLRTGGLNLATVGEDQDMSWRTGLNLSRSVNLNFSFSSKRTKTRGQSSSTKTRTINWFLLEDHPEFGIPFMNWSLRWSNLEKLPLLNKIPWRVSLDHSYSGNHGSNDQNGKTVSDKYTRQFQPLVGFTINFTNGISANIRLSHTFALDRNYVNNVTGERKTTGRQITASAGYQHRGGLAIPLPFFDNVKIQNTINFNLDFNFGRDYKEERRGEAANYAVTSEMENWSVKPYITYSFTDKVTGSFNFEYRERYTIPTGRQIDRKVGFDMNIAIRGS